MRTKTLLIGAAALAVSVISSQAQGTVYSQNVVGYINQTIPAGHYAEFGNQLVNGSDVNQSNNAVSSVLASGLISDPNGPPSGSNTVLLVFNGTGYAPYYYFNVADGGNYGVNGSTAGWYDLVGNPSPVTLPQGSSAFVQNTWSGGSMTFTITGTVLQGTNALVTVPTGYSFLSLGTPIATNVDAAGIGLPDSKLTSDPNGPPTGHNDQYLFWNGTAYVPYYFYNVSDGGNYGVNGSTAGFYDAIGNPCPSSSFPSAGQGFVYYHYGSPFTYTNTFVVQ